MLEMLDQPGVVYRGMVPAATLQNALASSGFWLYPSIYPETSCTVAVKAICAGAIPVTLRWPLSALPEVTRGYDAGPDFQDWFLIAAKTAG